jgi:hypothetical protein
MQLRLKLNTSEERSKRLSWFKNQLRESTKEFNTSPLKLKLFTIPREITTSLLPPKPELNTWEFKDKLPPLLLELLPWLDTNTQELNKEAELELEPPILPPTTLPNPPLLLIKLTMLLLNLLPHTQLEPTRLQDTLPSLLLLPLLTKLVTLMVEVESDKEDTLLEAVESDKEDTFQAATSSPATRPLLIIDPQ